LGDEFQFKIITSDRDFGATNAHPEIKIDGWNGIGKADVFYASPKKRSLTGFKNLIDSTTYDVLYLNSFFSPHFTIKPLLLRKLRLIPEKPIIVAPRGEFSPGALGLKILKKRVYLLAAKALGFYRGVIWQASSEHEELDIRRCLGNTAYICIAPNLPPMINEKNESFVVKEKTKGSLKIIFLSRISRKKNLNGALEMLKGVKGKVQFNIYGPMEDKSYWAECQKIIGNLPGNIEVRHYGSVTHEKVGAVMGEHDLFFFPTLGENFGHVILEALCAGCPILISDQTPWHDLEKKGVGWDLPLNRPELFQEILQNCVEMDQDAYGEWSRRAMKYGIQVTQDDKVVAQNRQLFYHAMGTMSNHNRERNNV
ncbi:MAG: glycosyltransferase, partial [Syntrophaceae bacterium]|nr:glycosyltransferase [Syntrophaceae bacterium]